MVILSVSEANSIIYFIKQNKSDIFIRNMISK